MSSHDAAATIREVYGFDVTGWRPIKAGTVTIDAEGVIRIRTETDRITPSQLDAICRVLDGD